MHNSIHNLTFILVPLWIFQFVLAEEMVYLGKMAGLMLVDFYNSCLFICLLICFHTMRPVLAEKDGWIWGKFGVSMLILFMYYFSCLFNFFIAYVMLYTSVLFAEQRMLDLKLQLTVSDCPCMTSLFSKDTCFFSLLGIMRMTSQYQNISLRLWQLIGIKIQLGIGYKLSYLLT